MRFSTALAWAAFTRRRSSAFTLIELLVVIAIISILAAILFPVFAQAREKARQTACLSNCKQIALGAMQYIQDYDETFPKGWHGYPEPGYTWHYVLNPYIKNGGANAGQGVFLCPSWSYSNQAQRSYGWNIGTNPHHIAGTRVYTNGFGYFPGDNAPYRTLPEISRPAETIFCGDISVYPAPTANRLYIVWVQTNTSHTPSRHQGGASYCFADGHARWLHQKTAHAQRDLFIAAK